MLIINFLPTDPQGPDIDAQACSLVYQASFIFIFQPKQVFDCKPKKYTQQANLDANFEDRNAFVIGMAKFGEEAAVQSTLNETLEKGQRHAVDHDDNDNDNHDDNDNDNYQRSRR